MAQSKYTSEHPEDFGIGDKYIGDAGRLINADGSFNIEVHGKQIKSLYTGLIEMSWGKFLASISALFVSVNALFAMGYFLIGVEAFGGLQRADAPYTFVDLIYFSIQTSTTVGYGHIVPVTHPANILASLDAFIGLLIFALYSGLFYARFSRPKLHLMITDSAVVAPYIDGMTSFQFRVVNAGSGRILNVRSRATATWLAREDGELRRKYQSLALEREEVALLPLNWTIVHPINSESPFYKLTMEGAKQCNIEVIVHISAFDEMYGHEIHLSKSYDNDEILMNHKFEPMYHQKSGKVILELEKLNEARPV